jgi:CRISPR-associated protein Csd1
MILQALHDYYLRRCADPDPARRLPAHGLELKELGFALDLDAQGRLVQITDLRRPVGSKLIGTPFLVPKGVKKTFGIAANLLWDNAEYVLGLPDGKKLEAAVAKGKADEYLARLADMQVAFIARIEALPPAAQADEGITAVLAFLKANPRQQAEAFAKHADLAASGAAISLRLVDDDGPLVCQRPIVVQHAGTGEGDEESSESPAGLCMVTGSSGPVARLHTAIKGVWGAQTSGANIVSFNLDAFNSYGRSQGTNAPVSEAAAFAYTTALNALLARDSAQRMQVGDASTVFWAQQADPLEDALALLIGGDDNPDAHVQQVKALLQSVRSGAFHSPRGDNRFFMLGLAPNAARIAVRFWHAAPLAELAPRIAAWFNDIAMVRGPNDAEYPSLFRLLAAVAVQGKADNIPPRLGGDLMRSIFTGAPYPAAWLNAAVQRCRSERQVNHLRAAAIKACLLRCGRTGHDLDDIHPGEITPMLDLHNPSPAYRLGRLFATLEKIQEEANPGLNATIRERYYGAASSTPVAVFTTLMRLKNHHLAKIANRGRVVNLERLLAEIMSGIDDIPGHMNLPDQGRFAVGYYHQRQDFYTPRTAQAPAATPDTESTQGAA